MPLIERCDGHHFALQVQRRIPHLLVVRAISPRPRVRHVPRPHRRVVIARPHGGDEQRRRLKPLGTFLQSRPVVQRAAEHEALRREVGVEAVEATLRQAVAVAVLHHQTHRDDVVGRVSDLRWKLREECTVEAPCGEKMVLHSEKGMM